MNQRYANLVRFKGLEFWRFHPEEYRKADILRALQERRTLGLLHSVFSSHHTPLGQALRCRYFTQ